MKDKTDPLTRKFKLAHWIILAVVVLVVAVGCRRSEPPNGPSEEPGPSPTVPNGQTPSPPTLAAEPDPAPTMTASRIPSTLTPTPVPEPTATPDNRSLDPSLQPVSFSESDFTDSSVDVMDELSYFGVGGGPPGWCFNDEGREYPYSDEVIPGRPIEINEYYLFTTCWPAGLSVEVTVTDPNGALHDFQVLEVETILDEGDTQINYRFKTDILTDPIGVYEIRYESDALLLTQDVFVLVPSEPRVYWLDNDDIVLHRFPPNETVSLFFYVEGVAEGVLEKYGSVEFKVNAVGDYYLQPQLSERVTGIAVIGETVGWVEPRLFGSRGAFLEPMSWPISPTGVEACQLNSRQYSEGDDRVVLIEDHARFDSSGALVGTMPAGASVRVNGRFPEWQEIVSRPGEFGWHWFVEYEELELFDRVWEGLFIECQP